MIQYIYFLKCPNCEDESFDFFDEAKASALSCLSSKPIITQVEVNRNDFGECTDSKDLGTIWSWEDEVNVTDAEPAITVFTKDDLVSSDVAEDPEFAALDNSVDYEPVPESRLDSVPDNFRRPIPDGMTIEELVEEMEENEDTVECTWCEDLFDKSECRYEVDLGWLCSRCEAAIKSRGETLTFRENNYWDFLDEDVELEEAGNSKYNFKYLHYNEHAKKDIIDKADLHPVTYKYVYGNTLKVPFVVTDIQNYPPYKTISKSAGAITDFTIENDTIMFTIDNNGRTISQDFKTVVSRAAKKSTTADFLNAFYSIVREVNKGSNLGISKNRDFDFNTSVKKSPKLAAELRDHIIKVQYEIPLTEYTAEDLLAIYAGSGAEITQKDEQDANKAADNLAKIYDNFFDGWKYGDAAEAAGLVVERPVLREDGSLRDTLSFIGSQWHAVGKITFDCPVGQLSEEARDLIQSAKLDGNINDLLNKKEIDCIRLAYALTSYFDNVKFYENFSDGLTSGSDTVTTEREPELLTASLDKKSFLEELEEPDVYRSRLTMCPECGENKFDPDTGICGNCGFNILLEEFDEVLSKNDQAIYIAEKN